MPCDQCRYAECRVFFTIMLNVIMQNVVMLSEVAPLKTSVHLTITCQFQLSTM
jgi:hypothetical protein